MKNIILLILVIVFSTCNSANYITVKHRKPVNRNRPFNKKRDKRKQRVKYVKVKILRQTNPGKPEKAEKVREKEDITAKDEITHETDSTGSPQPRH